MSGSGVVVARRGKRQDVKHAHAVASGVAKSSLRTASGSAVDVPVGARFFGVLLLRSRVLLRVSVRDVFQPGDFLGILVSGIAHEINNPNHTIGLNVPLLRDLWSDAASLLDRLAAAEEGLRVGRMPWSEARGEAAAMLDDVQHASERIRNIVTELRGFALDHDPGERRTVSLNDVVTGSLRLLGKHIAKATKRFELALAPKVLFVAGNASRLEQVVINLVLNACQALLNDEQGIRIETGAEDGCAFIRVRDEGRGIAAEDLAKIRTPFFTTKRAEGGTGLGLAVSDRIAGEQGGELTFESEVGRGTTATLWLPLERR